MPDICLLKYMCPSIFANKFFKSNNKQLLYSFYKNWFYCRLTPKYSFIILHKISFTELLDVYMWNSHSCIFFLLEKQIMIIKICNRIDFYSKYEFLVITSLFPYDFSFSYIDLKSFKARSYRTFTYRTIISPTQYFWPENCVFSMSG